MHIKTSCLKNILMASAILTSVLLFFSFFTISIPIFESFLESSSFSVSFFSLPSFVEKNALGLITRLCGKGTSVAVLLLCAVLKYVCLLSSCLGVYGIWEMCRKKKNTRFVFASAVMALAMCVLAFLVLIIVNVFILRYAGTLTEIMNLETDLELNFLPTIWLFLATCSSSVSLIALYNWQKRE